MAKYCTQCGAIIEDGIAFCTECGKKTSEETFVPQAQPQPTPVSQPAVQPVPQAAPQPAPQPAPRPAPQPGPQEPNVSGTPYEPITTGGFVGILFLMGIPVLGFLLTIIWACGGCRKLSKRAFARANLIWLAIGLILSLILGLVAWSMFDTLLRYAGIDPSAFQNIEDTLGLLN